MLLSRTMTTNPASFKVDQLDVRIFADARTLGVAAAADAAGVISDAIAQRGLARVMVATGNSQLEVIKALVEHHEVEWGKVQGFHMDEYVGIPAHHPASFRLWIRTRFAEKVRPREMHYIEGDRPDPDAVARRYASLLAHGPMDIAFVGIGENGHIAFNDPPVADFNDPLLVKRVTLDETCRAQQVGEGHFPTVNDVPREAVTVSCRGLLEAKHWVCCVPERRKARAVRDSLEGPISTACPGSVARRHPHAILYLDKESSSLLSPRLVSA